MIRILTTTLALFALTCITACGDSDHDGHSHDDGGHNAFAAVSKAICVLTPTDSTELKEVRGTITFTQTKSGVLVEANVTGLKPNSKHGFHIHQWGNTSAMDGTATGGYYDPAGAGIHGLPSVHAHGDVVHAITTGDAGGLGNLETDSQGNAVYTMTYENLTLTGHNALLGRAVLIHLNEDTGEQSEDNDGPTVAQGVIGIANPE